MQATGLRIYPGAWRPHYRWEHIAWVSPSWPCQDYVWLDFPEAIFTDRGLLFLSHINPRVPSVYTDLPRVEWHTVYNGLRFHRRLPNHIAFGGSVVRATDHSAALTLWIENRSSTPLRQIKLQTCTFLRACKEFAEYTMDNKFIHVPDRGWVSCSTLSDYHEEKGSYGFGWRGGPKVADLPVMLAKSTSPEPRFMAMTWFHDTISMIGNAKHPCMHADPKFPDLEPGQRHEIHGALMFIEGAVEDFRMPSAPDQLP
jgi:hypothetical protein